MRALLILIGVALIWGGGQGLYTALANLEPTAMSCREAYTQRPKAKWVQLTDCKASVLEAAHEESLSGSVERMYVPLYPNDMADDEELGVAILVSSEASRYTQPYLKMAALPEEELLGAVLSDFDSYYFEDEVVGLVRFGIELSDDEVRQLEGLDMGLTEDFLIVDDDEEPTLVASGLLFGGGLLSFLAGLGSFLLKLRKH